MSAYEERTVALPGGDTRVWEAGSGAPVGVFGGLLGLPKWPAFLDQLAAHRRVIAPSLPGQPGGHVADDLDDQLDWILAAGDVFHGAGLSGTDLIGVSVGGALAAEVAAVWPDEVRRLVLIAPFGVFDEAEPLADVFAQQPGALPGLLSNNPDSVSDFLAAPEGEDAVEWDIVQLRASMAAARFLWPLGDTRLAKRLGRITCPTLLIWGEDDRAIPPGYANRFADTIAGDTRIVTIPGAGHMAEWDSPEAVTEAVLSFLA